MIFVRPFGVTSPRIEFLDNAVLESFAIHLRNLLDFFYSKRILRDDVVAEHYFGSGCMPQDFPKPTQSLIAAKTRADKQVAHLTSTRLSGNDPEKQWHVVPLMGEMIKVIKAFVASASAEKLDPEFVNRVTLLFSQKAS